MPLTSFSVKFLPLSFWLFLFFFSFQQSHFSKYLQRRPTSLSLHPGDFLLQFIFLPFPFVPDDFFFLFLPSYLHPISLLIFRLPFSALLSFLLLSVPFFFFSSDLLSFPFLTPFPLLTLAFARPPRLRQTDFLYPKN